MGAITAINAHVELEKVNNVFTEAQSCSKTATSLFGETINHDTSNPDAQTVHIRGGMATGHLHGEVPVGDINLPETIYAIGEDIAFIQEHLQAVGEIGNALLEQLGAANQILEVVEGTQSTAVGAMKVVARRMSS
jgi:hypothetical protein